MEIALRLFVVALIATLFRMGFNSFFYSSFLKK